MAVDLSSPTTVDATVKACLDNIKFIDEAGSPGIRRGAEQLHHHHFHNGVNDDGGLGGPVWRRRASLLMVSPSRGVGAEATAEEVEAILPAGCVGDEEEDDEVAAVTGHLNRGGNYSDTPPPAHQPSSNPAIGAAPPPPAPFASSAGNS